MARNCQLCSRIDRAEVDARIVSGREPLLRISATLGVPYSNLRRHQAHILNLVARRAGQERLYAHELLDGMDHLEQEAHRLQATAENSGDVKTALTAINCKLRIVELKARIMGEIRDQVHNTSVLNVSLVDETTARRIAQAFLERAAGPEVTIDAQA